MSRHTPKIVYVILSIGFLLQLYLASGFIVLNNDEGNYLYDASLILEGSVPYRDFFMRPPLLPYLIALSIKVFGTTLIAGRIVSIIANSITAYFMFKIGSMLFGRKEGLLAMLLYLFSTPIFMLSIIKTEPLQVMFMTMFFFLLMRAEFENRKAYYWMSGLPLGLAILTRPTAPLLIALGLPLLLYCLHKDMKAAIVSCAKVAIPCSLIVATVMGYFFIVAGLWTTIKTITFGGGTIFSTLLSVGDWITRGIAIYMIAVLNPFILALFFFCLSSFGYSYLSKERFAKCTNALKWVVASWIGLIAVMSVLAYFMREHALRFFSDYFNFEATSSVKMMVVSSIIRLVIVCAILPTSWLLSNYFLQRRGKRFATGKPYMFLLYWGFAGLLFYLFYSTPGPYYYLEVLAPLYLLSAALLARYSSLIFRSAFGKMLLALFIFSWLVSISFWHFETGLQISQAERVAAYIEKNTKEDDKVFSMSSIFVFLADRRLVLDMSHPALYASYQERMEERMRVNPPAYVIMDRYMRRRLSSHSSLIGYIQDNYRFDKRFDDPYWPVDVLKLKSRSPMPQDR